MALVQLREPSDFGAALEKRWDETDPVSGDFIAANTPVSGVPGLYALDGRVRVVVNEGGLPVVLRRDCAVGDFNCNFWSGDAILVAPDLSPRLDFADAPIRLRFSSGVKAVGGWLSANGPDPFDAGFNGQLLQGAMWVALAASPTIWHLVRAEGVTGTVLQSGVPVTAPFLGLRATDADRIIEVRFDVALAGGARCDKVALSELTVEV